MLNFTLVWGFVTFLIGTATMLVQTGIFEIPINLIIFNMLSSFNQGLFGAWIFLNLVNMKNRRNKKKASKAKRVE